MISCSPASPFISAIPFAHAGLDLPVPILSPEASNRLAVIGSVVRFAKGSLLYEEGQPADFIYNVIKGEVKVFCGLSSGRRQITAFLFPGDLAGLAGNGRYISTAQAVTPVTTYRLALSALGSLLHSDPDLEHRFLCKACNELRTAQWHALTLARHDARGKIAMFLRELNNHFVGSKLATTLAVPMTRSDIADYVGLSLETVSRSFRELQDSGIIRFEDRHNVRIIDQARLEKLAAAM